MKKKTGTSKRKPKPIENDFILNSDRQNDNINETYLPSKLKKTELKKKENSEV